MFVKWKDDLIGQDKRVEILEIRYVLFEFICSLAWGTLKLKKRWGISKDLEYYDQSSPDLMSWLLVFETCLGTNMLLT